MKPLDGVVWWCEHLPIVVRAIFMGKAGPAPLVVFVCSGCKQRLTKMAREMKIGIIDRADVIR